ncbi:virion structural protein [Escherichia phage vB_EcoS_CEB_EC3a]|uniref:Uncharacterized protein n=1 Tax=Escherichia phage vB_EcoS_CEB_EC3a TaxID=1933774 RepID=A0A1Q1PWC2_9CAUD|nr:virion structural protein [Escherichia phage vB_EcoS_CEB_EC3a]AQN32389.1 hypothetical protein Ec3a_18 [Escherichia phage vB_EcoS_CEB_EC3a]
MKAVFKGYKKAGCLEFTIGKIYELSTATEAFGFLKVTDDDGFNGVIIPGDTYDFEVLIPDEFINKKKQFKYYINGEVVTKTKFDDTLLCVKDFKSDGIDTSSIKFEVKFE